MRKSVSKLSNVVDVVVKRFTNINSVKKDELFTYLITLNVYQFEFRENLPTSFSRDLV